jgi:RNA polymerase sigma-70 factor (ECF subfamily)
VKEEGGNMDIDEIVEKFSSLIYKICYNMLNSPEDAEDVTQEVFINLYKNLNRYLDLNENEMKNLVCKIALNKCRDIIKSKSYKLDKITDYDEESIEKYEVENKIDEHIFKKERKLYVNKMINELKEPYKSVLIEYYINEKSLDELAQDTNKSKGTLKMQIHRAKEILKEKMNVNGGDDFL